MNAAERVFLDSNVIVYSCDPGNVAKWTQADMVLDQLFATGKPNVSTQILAEVFWSITRKIPNRLSTQDASDELRKLHKVSNLLILDWTTIEKALTTIANHNFAFWDALVHAAAVASGSTFLLSEDMQHRRVLDGVTILNPFAADFKITEILPP